MNTAFAQTGFASVGLVGEADSDGTAGRPEEIADAVAYLSSSGASYIAGVVLPVDGGWSSLGLPDN